MTEEEKIVLVENDDKEMLAVSKTARTTFKYFWREMSWEFRRIIPAVELACVKVIFMDDEDESSSEHLWMDEVAFDGKHISGTLINSPTWLSSVSMGDFVKTSLAEISDWMFVINGEVYGAYTVNLMRSRMQPDELKEHDEAWGLYFGNPNEIKIVRAQAKKKKEAFDRLFNRQDPLVDDEAAALKEHPMCINMADPLRKQLDETPEMLHDKDENGWTLLHHQALAGNTLSVQILLEYGADKALRTNENDTALDLARTLNWEHVIRVLSTQSD